LDFVAGICVIFPGEGGVTAATMKSDCDFGLVDDQVFVLLWAGQFPGEIVVD
jgi:hypothetical protein